jgi:hypothetical protein
LILTLFALFSRSIFIKAFKRKIMTSAITNNQMYLSLGSGSEFLLFLFLFSSITILVYYFGIVLSMILIVLSYYITSIIAKGLYPFLLASFLLQATILTLSYFLNQFIGIPYSLLSGLLFVSSYFVLFSTK